MSRATLVAAQVGASQVRRATHGTFPRIPSGDVMVDRGRLSHQSGFSGPRRVPSGIRTPEITLPAWQVSQIGLQRPKAPTNL